MPPASPTWSTSSRPTTRPTICRSPSQAISTHLLHPDNQVFVRPVQNARPISDIAYFPLVISGTMVGFVSVARAGLQSSYYSDDQLEVVRFIVGFLSDAFARSLILPPPEENCAYIDFQGSVVTAGAKIREAFAAISAHGSLPELLSAHYRQFLHGPFRVGMDRFTFCSENESYTFLFRLLRPHGLPLRQAGFPFASVALVDTPADTRPGHLLGLWDLSRRFDLTPRECEVVSGIYKGLSNKAIAYALGIDESTVKRHTHNIYEKSGFRSRVELVLGLSRVLQIN